MQFKVGDKCKCVNDIIFSNEDAIGSGCNYTGYEGVITGINSKHDEVILDNKIAFMVEELEIVND